MDVPSDAELAYLAGQVGARLVEREWRLATGESCTGGWIAKVCTDLPGSSRWFLGGAVVYANAFKTQLLAVSPELVERHGAVSAEVVRAMATGVLRQLGGELAVAVSGIAGPEGGSADKPVGTVWIAWAVRRDTGVHVETACERYAGSRESVRRLAVQAALRGVLHRASEPLAPAD
jgi:nicotinamide-nucleotide amidase